MDENEDFEGDSEHVCVPVGRFTKWDVLIHFFAMLMAVFSAVSQFFEGMVEASVAAANKQSQDDHFHQAASLDIETIVSGGPDA